MIDIYAGILALLMADPDVTGLLQVSPGGYVGEIPPAGVDQMPARCFLIVPSGGQDNRSRIQVSTPRMDIWCYGATYADASSLDLAICSALQNIQRNKIAGTLIHSCIYGGGPWMHRDRDTFWPIVVRSYQITAAEIAAN